MKEVKWIQIIRSCERDNSARDSAQKKTKKTIFYLRELFVANSRVTVVKFVQSQCMNCIFQLKFLILGLVSLRNILYFNLNLFLSEYSNSK